MPPPESMATVHEMQALADDKAATPARRAAARRAVEKIAECERLARVLLAARAVAGCWDNPKLRVDVWELVALLEQQGSHEAAARRRDLGTALDALRRQVREADAEAWIGVVRGPGVRGEGLAGSA